MVVSRSIRLRAFRITASPEFLGRGLFPYDTLAVAGGAIYPTTGALMALGTFAFWALDGSLVSHERLLEGQWSIGHKHIRPCLYAGPRHNQGRRLCE